MSPQTRELEDVKKQRTRLQAVLLEGGKEDGGGCRGRKAEGEQRNEYTGHGSVVGGLGAGDAFDSAMAEFGGVPGAPFLEEIGQESRDFGAAGGKDAEGKAEGGAAQPRFPRARPFLARHEERATNGIDLLVAEIGTRGDVDGFADREQPDGDDDDVDAVEEARDPEGQARLAGQHVDADEADGET